jgi:hypothetical protein
MEARARGLFRKIHVVTTRISRAPGMAARLDLSASTSTTGASFAKFPSRRRLGKIAASGGFRTAHRLAEIYLRLRKVVYCGRRE